MKMNIVNKTLLLFLLAVLALSCQENDVDNPSFDVTVEKSVYKVGETVRFAFSGDADFVTFYSGVDNYNAGSVNGTIKGSRYSCRLRAKESGRSILSFNCKKDANGVEDYAELRLFLSTDFNGCLTMKDIHSANWNDITDLAKWPDASTASGKNIASGNIDLSEWNGQVVYLAFRYTAKAGQKQNGWSISSFNLKNYVESDSLPFTIWANASGAKCGSMSNAVQESGSPAYLWKLGTTLTCSGIPDGKDDFESWVITSPVDPSQVTPDYGTILTSYSEVLPEFYDYKYYKPGKFMVTFVSRNVSVFGDMEKVQNFEIEVVKE